MRTPPDDIDQYIGLRVRQRRRDLRFSMQKVAKAVGVSVAQLGKYESGVNKIGASRLAQIAAALSVPPTYCFMGASEGKRSPALQLSTIENSGARRDVFDLATAVEAIPDAKARVAFIALGTSLGEQVRRARRRTVRAAAG